MKQLKIQTYCSIRAKQSILSRAYSCLCSKHSCSKNEFLS